MTNKLMNIKKDLYDQYASRITHNERKQAVKERIHAILILIIVSGFLLYGMLKVYLYIDLLYGNVIAEIILSILGIYLFLTYVYGVKRYFVPAYKHNEMIDIFYCLCYDAGIDPTCPFNISDGTSFSANTKNKNLPLKFALGQDILKERFQLNYFLASNMIFWYTPSIPNKFLYLHLMKLDKIIKDFTEEIILCTGNQNDLEHEIFTLRYIILSTTAELMHLRKLANYPSSQIKVDMFDVKDTILLEFLNTIIEVYNNSCNIYETNLDYYLFIDFLETKISKIEIE